MSEYCMMEYCLSVYPYDRVPVCPCIFMIVLLFDRVTVRSCYRMMVYLFDGILFDGNTVYRILYDGVPQPAFKPFLKNVQI